MTDDRTDRTIGQEIAARQPEAAEAAAVEESFRPASSLAREVFGMCADAMRAQRDAVVQRGDLYQRQVPLIDTIVAIAGVVGMADPAETWIMSGALRQVTHLADVSGADVDTALAEFHKWLPGGEK